MFLSVDIGGTKTLLALFSNNGRVLRRVRFKTDTDFKTYQADLKENLKLFKNRKLKSVVVAIPGIVQKNCSVEFGNRDWGEVDLFTPINELFDCPVYFENDANLGALFESHGLPGRTIFLTFSTGIGGGIIDDNRICPESTLFEPGHIIYNYNGESNEWEDIAAASAIRKKFSVELATSVRKKRDLEEVAKRIYLGLPDIISTYQPNTIIFGGPMGMIFGLYEKYLPKSPNVKYARPKRPNESVIYGAYLYAKQKEDSSLIDRLKMDYPEFRFMPGKKFAFRPPKTILIGPKEPFFDLLILHELSHALLGHRDFDADITRLKMESEAWDKTRELATKYGVKIDEGFIEGELDTYRDWLHKKSRCPKCGLTRFQDLDKIYHCPRCEGLT